MNLGELGFVFVFREDVLERFWWERNEKRKWEVNGWL